LGAETPNAFYPLWPYASDYDLHEKAGGLPLYALAAPNVRIKNAGGLQSGTEVMHPY